MATAHHAQRSDECDNADNRDGDMSRPLLQYAPNTMPEANPSPSVLPSSSSPSILDGVNSRADHIATGSWRACAFIIGKISANMFIKPSLSSIACLIVLEIERFLLLHEIEEREREREKNQEMRHFERRHDVACLVKLTNGAEKVIR